MNFKVKIMKINATLFQDGLGNYSLSRVIVFICVCVALLFSAIILILSRNDVMTAAAAIAIVFNSIAVPSLVFLFGQKKTESTVEINAKNNETLIENEKNTAIPE